MGYAKAGSAQDPWKNAAAMVSRSVTWFILILVFVYDMCLYTIVVYKLKYEIKWGAQEMLK